MTDSAAVAQRTFHRKLYAHAALKDALEAYAALAALDVVRDDEGWTVTFADIQGGYAPELLASEFANYVLAGTVERRR